MWQIFRCNDGRNDNIITNQKESLISINDDDITIKFDYEVIFINNTNVTYKYTYIEENLIYFNNLFKNLDFIIFEKNIDTNIIKIIVSEKTINFLIKMIRKYVIQNKINMVMTMLK